MKLLLLDIETAPNLAAVWGLYDQNIATNQLIKPGYVLSWAAKWHKDKKIHFRSILDGHKRMIKDIHKLMSESEAICHYNGTKFDIPTLNREFLLLGLKPPAPSAQIDLLKVARGRFKLASNKLDYVSQQLGLGKKLEHKGMDLWLECMAKDKKAWKTMSAYNKQDVRLLERVYDRLLPWIQHHPNLSVFLNAPVCPNCGGKRSVRQGYKITKTCKYQMYQCKDCGTWHRATKTEPLRERRVQA